MVADTERLVSDAFAIEMEAKSIEGAIATATPDVLKGLISRLGELGNLAQRKGVSVIAIEAAMSRADMREAELEVAAVNESYTTSYPAASPYEKGCCQHMHKHEKAFFESIDPSKTYKMYRMAEDGSMEEYELSGKEIRDAFLDVKSHTLDEKIRASLLDKDGKPLDAVLPPDKKLDEMKKLHTSLDIMEDFHHGELMRKGREGEHRDHHGRFQLAHRHVEKIEGILHECVECHHDKSPMANAKRQVLRDKLESAQKEMKSFMQHEIIDRTLTGHAQQPHAREQIAERTSGITSEHVTWEPNTQFSPAAGAPGQQPSTERQL